MSSVESAEPPSIFDEIAEEDDDYNDHTQATSSSPGSGNGFDLRPPAPPKHILNTEALAERLFSVDHLNLILRTQSTYQSFTTFVNQYRPHSAPTLVRYLETQKALSAIEYANSIAEQLGTSKRIACATAATVDKKFEIRSKRALEELLTDALPAYITHRLTQVVTECLVKEVTGTNAPILRELVQGLAEVYCMADPSLPDCPIVYASEEFYRTTQYGKDYVIGKNCRFLQGPKTARHTVSRLAEAIKTGQECSETILNYRRDGSPFLNLCLVAPLYDNRGKVRYFLGCQIDVSNLLEGGRGLDSFQALLEEDQHKIRYGQGGSKNTLKALGNLSQLLNTEELTTVRQRNRFAVEPGHPGPVLSAQTSRRYVGMEDPNEAPNIWPSPNYGISGRLPGVYQNFLLVRPYPSLRITFTSPALRIPGLTQSRLLDRIGGPHSVRENIQSALADGIRLTAKVSWLTTTNTASSIKSEPDFSHSASTATEGKPRWIHCTPLMGADNRIGVWMVVMVEKEGITGMLNAHNGLYNDGGIAHAQPLSRPSTANGGNHGGSLPVRGASAAHRKFTEDKLYEQYERREGRDVPSSPRTSDSGFF
ncbi:hypothetical protein K490DRAFT_38460 [Saccharata proteae CBS 121410]|uniref:PAC domain-containing protein n=1 Tax=Saccharata proteae CBS 121410 TaxID=1314787 RepID=A0A6A5YAV1_9PEZI|nr:hypothetical protein K490DRAFT_38460 [Saccharata proteae CBS 121410]